MRRKRGSKAGRVKLRTRVVLDYPGGGGLNVIFSIGRSPIGRVANGTTGTVRRWFKGGNVGVAFDGVPPCWGLVACPAEWLQKRARQ